MSKGGNGQRMSSRCVGYSSTVTDEREEPTRKLLEAAVKAGTVIQWDDGSADGGRFFWWNGVPGAAMRELNKAIGGRWERRHLDADDIRKMNAAK